MRLLSMVLTASLVGSCQLTSAAVSDAMIQLGSRVISFCVAEYEKSGRTLDARAKRVLVVAESESAEIVVSNGGGVGSDLPYIYVMSCGVVFANEFTPYLLMGPWGEKPIVHNLALHAAYPKNPLVEMVYAIEDSGFTYIFGREYDPDGKAIFGSDETCDDQNCPLD